MNLSCRFDSCSVTGRIPSERAMVRASYKRQDDTPDNRDAPYPRASRVLETFPEFWANEGCNRLHTNQNPRETWHRCSEVSVFSSPRGILPAWPDETVAFVLPVVREVATDRRTCERCHLRQRYRRGETLARRVLELQLPVPRAQDRGCAACGS